MLEQRQVIAVVAGVVQQPEHEARGDLAAGHRDRTGDGRPKLVPGHPRHEVLALIQGLRKPRVVHAVANEVGPHRQHHIDRQRGLVDGFEQQLYERNRIVPGDAVVAVTAESEQFLELIDEDEDVVVRREVCLLHGLHQAARAPAERGLEHHAVGGRELGILIAEDGRRIERRGEMAQGIFTRAHDGHPPARPSLDHHAALERRQQAGSDQRRLSAARRAGHAEKPVEPQPPHQVIDLLLAAEKEMILIGLERAQSWKRINSRLPSAGR